MDPNEETPLAAPSKGGFGKSLGRGKIAGLLALALGLGVFGALAATDHKTTDIAFGERIPLWVCDGDAERGPCKERFNTYFYYTSVYDKCREKCRYGEKDYYGSLDGSDFYCGYGDSEDEVAEMCCYLWGDAEKKHDKFQFYPEDPCHPRYD